MNIYLTANSPGEVATWLRPVVWALQRAYASSPIEPAAGPLRIVVFLMPCVYATGREAAVAGSITGVEMVIPPPATLRAALTGRMPAALRQAGFEKGQGVLLHLGGEIKLSAWLAHRLGVPAYLYTEGFVNTAKAYRRIFVPHPRAAEKAVKHGAPADRIEVVGNLMVDAVTTSWTSRETALAGLGLSAEVPTVTVLPGSRQAEWEVALPFFALTVRELRRELPGLQAILAVSAFAEGLQQRWFPDDEPYRWVEVEGEPFLALNDRTGDAATAADLVLTLPGSNTVEIAALGRPMVVAAPLYRPESIPLEGLAGMIGRIPLIGRRLKRAAVLKFSRRVPFVALPNAWAGRMVTPELRGEDLQPWEVTAVARDLLIKDDERERIGIELKSIVGGTGAAARVAAELLRAAGENAG